MKVSIKPKPLNGDNLDMNNPKNEQSQLMDRAHTNDMMMIKGSQSRLELSNR